MAKDGTLSLPPVEATRAGADLNTPTGTRGLVVVCKTAGFVEFRNPANLSAYKAFAYNR